MPELVVRLRDREMERFEMTHARVTIGRDASCDLVIDNAGVSRTHAVVLFMDDQFRVRDAGSQNGITLNGQRVNDAVLSYGDRIGLGKFEVELVDNGTEPWDLEAGSEQRSALPKNVMSTVQMDAGSAARLRDEILRKKGVPKPAGASPEEPGEPRPKRRRKRPARAGSPEPVQRVPAQRLVPEAVLSGGATYPSSRRASTVPWFVWVIGLLGLFGLAALLIVRLT